MSDVGGGISSAAGGEASKGTVQADAGGASPWSLGRWVATTTLLALALFGLTTSKLQFGYEHDNIRQAEALVRGEIAPRPGGGMEPYTQGGLAEVLVYLPTAALRLALEQRGSLPGLQQILHPFVIPAMTALLCLVYFGLAYELYRRADTAAALTLALATATTIWPYAKFGMETHQTLWTLAALWAIVRYAAAPSALAALTLGCSLGMLMLTKITGLPMAAALAAAGVWAAARTGRGLRTAHVVAAALPAAVGLALLLFTNRLRYGGWLWGGRYGFDAETTPFPLWQALWAVVASPGKSIFLFSPPLLAALWFWGAGWRRFPALRPAVVVLLALALAHLRMRPWADETWGPRRLHYLTPVLLLPLGVWWEARPRLRPTARRLVWGALAAGVAVQVLAVSFDYTALAKVVGRTPVFAQEHTVWDPQLCPLRFNGHLWRSVLRRAAGSPSLPFVYRLHYLPWTAPPEPPPDWIFPLRGVDRLDLWPLQQRADWSDRPYWFVSASSWLALALAALLAATARSLVRALRRAAAAAESWRSP